MSGPRLPEPDRPAPLVALNAHIAEASARARQQLDSTASLTNGMAWPPLRSAERFRATWQRVSAEAEVAKAGQRVPDNAGPLNSHRLVQHTLGLMRQLSPDYLQAFLAQAEALLWLEQAQGLPRAVASKAVAGKAVVGRTGRKKK